MGKQSFDKKLDAIAALRDPADLRKALKDRNNFLVSKAAAAIARLERRELIPDLEASFDRFMNDPVKTDPQCWAKAGIAKALKELGHDDPALFIRGMKHIQLEPSYGRPEDSAPTLRATCALALVACALPRAEILMHLVDALGADPSKTVRIDAARAVAQMPGIDSALLLRLKALAGDPDPEVVGQCLVSLLEIFPKESLSFAARFLDSSDPDLRMEAAAALGESHEPESAQLLITSYETKSGPADFKRAILLILGASRHPEAAVFLLSLIENGRSDQAAIAIESLAAGRFREEFRDRVQVAVAARNETKLQAAFQKGFYL